MRNVWSQTASNLHPAVKFSIAKANPEAVHEKKIMI